MITAQLVKELREKSGAGMMECKKALEETKGHPGHALEYLRKLGLKAFAGKVGRIAADGIVALTMSAGGRLGVLLELNSETDFVAKNEEFVRFAEEVVCVIADKRPVHVEEVLKLKQSNGESVGERFNQLTARLGEKLSLRRFDFLEAKNDEKLGSYIHMGNKIGVLVSLRGKKLDDRIMKDIAMHVAAASPQYLNRSEIPEEVICKEKEIYREQLKTSGKPAEILEKILDGKVAKFVGDVCLNDQIFIKDPTGKKTVSKMLKEIDPTLEIVRFIRYQVGEGLEKKKDDFATEVAKMVGTVRA